MVRGNEEVGRCMYVSSDTKIGDVTFFDRLLPSGPDEKELQGSVRQLPLAFRSACDTPPALGEILSCCSGNILTSTEQPIS